MPPSQQDCQDGSSDADNFLLHFFSSYDVQFLILRPITTAPESFKRTTRSCRTSLSLFGRLTFSDCQHPSLITMILPMMCRFPPIQTISWLTLMDARNRLKDSDNRRAGWGNHWQRVFSDTSLSELIANCTPALSLDYLGGPLFSLAKLEKRKWLMGNVFLVEQLKLCATISTFLFILASAPRSFLLMLFALFLAGPILLSSTRTFLPPLNSLRPTLDRDKTRYIQLTFPSLSLPLRTVRTAGVSCGTNLGGSDIASDVSSSTWAFCCIGNCQIARLSCFRLNLPLSLDSGVPSFYPRRKACLG
jgi:hypothetical protein